MRFHAGSTHAGNLHETGKKGVTRTRTLKGVRVTPCPDRTHSTQEANEVSSTPRMIATVPTWDDLVRAEPRLAVLRSEVERITARDDQRFCANEHWYGYNGQAGIKRELVRLVGFRAENPDPVLHSMAAYDVAYQTLYALLPDCWDCDCAPRWVA